jgi:beta-xylosidase
MVGDFFSTCNILAVRGCSQHYSARYTPPDLEESFIDLRKMISQYLRLMTVLAAGLLPFAIATVDFSIADNTTIEKRGITLTPVMNGMNFPDPSIIRIGNEWWAFSTISHTYDFSTWTSFGEKDALPDLPSWVYPDAPAVWAPDVVHLAPGRFIMYYTAALKSNPRIHCLGIASASTVTGPYTPIGPDPWACPAAQGGAIDPAGYYDPKDNTRWVVYKIDANSIGH